MAGKPVAEISIINLALLQLQSGGITSVLDTNSPTAVAAAQIVPVCRRAALRSAIWNFAKKHDTIAKVTSSAPKFNFTSYYQLPTDYIRIVEIGTVDDQRSCKYKRYDIQGRYLLLDSTENSVPISYVRDEEDVALWDPLFVEAVTLELAVWMCPAITGDRAIQRELRERLREAYAEAATVDHQERPLTVDDVNPVREARNTFGDWGASDFNLSWTE